MTFADTTGRAQASLAATVTLTAADGGGLGGVRRVLGAGDPLVPGGHRDADRRPLLHERLRVTVTAYVVAPAGVPAADLVLRVSDLRNAGGAEGPWDRVTAACGDCADDPAALCAPLG